LDGRIAGIVCGEPTAYGLESTVVDATCNPPRVLRPGGISLEKLMEVCPSIEPYSGHQPSSISKLANSPGIRHKHYQPRAKVILITSTDADSRSRISELSSVTSEGSVCHYIGLRQPEWSTRFSSILVCSSVAEYAGQLFDFFRKADLSGADMICCESVEEIGLGVALLDRIRRAGE